MGKSDQEIGAILDDFMVDLDDSREYTDGNQIKHSVDEAFKQATSAIAQLIKKAKKEQFALDWDSTLKRIKDQRADAIREYEEAHRDATVIPKELGESEVGQ